MKLLHWLALFVLCSSTFALARTVAENPSADHPPTTVDEIVSEAEVPYGVGDWPESLGNHRAKIQVDNKADAVWVHLPWRRRDEKPEMKEIMVFDAATNKQVKNVVRVQVGTESGDLLFQPTTAPGEYYVYYMPFRQEGPAYCPTTIYLPPTDTADPAWKATCEPLVRKIKGQETKGLSKARVLQFQAINDFHRFDPMEVPATAAEVKTLLAKHQGKPYLVFPEDRRQPIRMDDALPLPWIRSGPQGVFQGEACRGEYYVFQLGVYAATQDMADVQYSAKPFQQPNAGVALGELTCFNTEGKDWLGRPFIKRLLVARGRVQPMWFGVQIPRDAAPGEYQTVITIKPENLPSMEIQVALKVNDQVLADAGDNDLWRHARLRWLNSTIGLDEDAYPPYTPIKVSDRTLRVLGRSFRFGDTGLPESIQSTFGKSVDRLDEPPQEILAGPIRFLVETAEGTKAFAGGTPRIIAEKSGAVAWESTSHSGPLTLHCIAKLECDGYVNYRLTLIGKDLQAPLELKDVQLEIPLSREVATYMMGLGRKGGYRPDKWDWKWDVRYANNHFWIGDVNAGLACKFKHVEDRWDYANMKQSGVYEDWGNGGQGGCRLCEESPDRVVLRTFTGPRKLAAGAELHFNFGLLATPFHTIDPEHWKWRYMHTQPWIPLPSVDDVVRGAAAIVNIHQGAGVLNPYINYPFIVREPLKKYIEEAHSKKIKVKLYYTVRLLSNYATEFWALRSMGNEIMDTGSGEHSAKGQADKPKGANGGSWLVEHLRRDYLAGWHEKFGNGHCDASVPTQGLSRLHNYYLEGLSWLIREQGIDGLYLDGAGFDREIMKRIRKTMDRTKPGCLIDLHEGNNYSEEYGMSNSASLQMELMPYINSLWFGELFNYDEPPDYWLVEMSGIPFGLTGEMLQGGGNPWRGMLYGMTTRLPWSGDPRPIWKVWDDFGIGKSRMIGYWDPDCPVNTGRKDILATAYVRDRQTLVAVASWSPKKEAVKIKVDWKSIGFDPSKTKWIAPEIATFQSSTEFSPSDEISVDPGRGWLLLLREK